jgi:hypothetical protein
MSKVVHRLPYFMTENVVTRRSSGVGIVLQPNQELELRQSAQLFTRQSAVRRENRFRPAEPAGKNLFCPAGDMAANHDEGICRRRIFSFF